MVNTPPSSNRKSPLMHRDCAAFELKGSAYQNLLSEESLPAVQLSLSQFPLIRGIAVTNCQLSSILAGSQAPIHLTCQLRLPW